MLRHGHIVARLVAMLLACAGGVVLAPVDSQAIEQVELKAAFRPDRLGASTAISFGFSIHNTEAALPPALTRVDLHLPAGMNQNASELGLATCQPGPLATIGPTACPRNSFLGYGTAYVAAQFGGEIIPEKAELDMFSGPPHSEQEVLYFAAGETPIQQEEVFPGQLVEEFGAFSADLITKIPLVGTVPGGEYVSTTRFASILGPAGVTYYRKVHGRLVPFHPQGILVPNRCPAHGFPMVVELRFVDGSAASAHTSVPCPKVRKH